MKRGVIPNMGDVSQATRVQLAQVGGRPARRTVTKRRATKKTASAKKRPVKRRAKASTTRAKKGRLKKGSPEAKRYMARIRKMRKR
jgi:hypothetical protein